MQKIIDFVRQHRGLSIAAGSLLLALILLLVGRGILHRQKLHINEPVAIYIPSGSTFDQLVDSLEAHDCITDPAVFRSMARARHLTEHVKSGRYLLQPGMSLYQVVNKLYCGNQDAVRLTINKHRTKAHLCEFLGRKLEMSGDTLLALLDDSAFCSRYESTPNTIIALFIQNTYDIYWNTTPEKLLDRMQKEYNRFWTPLRQGQCSDLGLSPVEIITLASIVEEETNADEEKPLIASVYLNRLRQGIPLQADPTLKYAVGDFTLRRLLNRHTTVDNPYNTYMYKGLPPGPICIPSIASIDAVLENHRSDYLYFCAKEDMSGRHNFARNADEHAANAARFHQALNSKGIYK